MPLDPPSNDDFASAKTIVAPRFDDIVDTTEATIEPEEHATVGGYPIRDGNGNGHTVWYRYSPATPGTLAVSTCQYAIFGQGLEYSGWQGEFNTVLGAYTGTDLSNLEGMMLSLVYGHGDDVCPQYAEPGTRKSTMLVAVAPGTTYWIQLAGREGVSGIARLHTVFTGSANE
jgi:hypothetical protein